MTDRVISDQDLHALYGEEEGPFLHRHSSLAFCTGICVLLRERFSQIRKTPWDSACSEASGWRQDYTAATIAILTEYDDSAEAENLLPRVTVQHQGTSYARVSIGDDVTENLSRLSKGYKRYAQFGTSNFAVEVLCTRRGECALLADIVGTSLNICTDILSRMLRIREVQPISIGPTVRQDGPTGKHLWRASISFSIGFETTWVTAPIAPTLLHAELYQRVMGGLEGETSQLTAVMTSPPLQDP